MDEEKDMVPPGAVRSTEKGTPKSAAPDLSVAERFPWIDPTLGYPSEVLREGARRLERSRYVAVRGGGAHKSMSWMGACQSRGLERIEGHEWELFTADKEGEAEGRYWVWGMYVEGIGAFDVMVPAEWVRDLTDAERAYYSGRQMGMYGSHSGRLSYTLNLPKLGNAEVRNAAEGAPPPDVATAPGGTK